MTPLFRRLQPANKFRITLTCIAQLLKIPKHQIVRVECWAYVLFVHRTDKGGQFISYRQLRQWKNAVACQIQNCSTWQQLRSLWLAIENDYKQYKEQYDDEYHPFVYEIWTKCWNTLWNQQTSTNSPAIAIHEMLDTNTFLAPPELKGGWGGQCVAQRIKSEVLSVCKDNCGMGILPIQVTQCFMPIGLSALHFKCSY